MSSLKRKLSLIIREEYKKWFAGQNISLKCDKGCAACCSVNVKITSIEGEMIYDFLQESGREEWFATVLKQPSQSEKLHLTTNGFAASCLAGEAAEVDTPGLGHCPFLVDECCSIYEVRPFSCRCFVSTIGCGDQSTAEVPAIVLTASTVMMQLLEHVAQGEYWGNLQDVLVALSDLPKYKAIRKRMAGLSLELQARARLLKALPIPGFLLDDKEYGEVMTLLEKIFNTTVDGRRVEDILNGK
jgi:Fe-S-cluster containining protein